MAENTVKMKMPEVREISKTAKQSIVSLDGAVKTATSEMNTYILGLAEGMGINNRGWNFDFRSLSFVKVEKKDKKEEK